MMTNLVETILTISLVTNTAVSPETRSVPIPCPEGRIGCAVYHSKVEPVENPRWRTVETKVIRIRKTSIPSLGKSWDEEEVVSKDIRFETRSEAWAVDPARTEKLRAGGVLLMLGSELPMVTAPMDTTSSISWSLVASNAITSGFGTNDITLVFTNSAYAHLLTNAVAKTPPFLWAEETVRTMYDSRGRFRAVGTNIVDGILSTTWKYEVVP